MPRFVPKANAAMKNATFARWPQNTASIHHIPFKSTSDFFHDDFFWCHRTASHPAASFKVQCWDGFGDEDQDSALSSSIIQCGLGSSLAFLILNGYIYIYVWIYTYTLISVITENLSVYMKQKLYKYLEICLLMHLSFLGVDYIHGLGFARSAKKYEKKDPGTVAPSAKPKAKPDGTGTDASNGSAPVPKRRRRAAAWWYIYFLVEHYTSNTEIIGMIAGNLWNQVQV